MSETIVEVQSLCRRFGKKTALDDVSLSIPAGTVFGLVGENGAGKTTLLKHLLGLLKPTSGTVRVFGQNPLEVPEVVLKDIGFLSEDRDLPLWMRIDELMSFTSAFYPTWDQRYAAELVEMFDLKPDQRLESLSRGQLARTGLLLALAHRPRLLLLDEPSSGLDPVVRRDILAAIIRTIADDGRTVLFSSHLLDEVQRVSDHVAMLHGGQLVLCEPLEQVLSSHSRWVIRLKERAAVVPCIPGALNCSGEGHEWTVVFNGEHELVRQWVQTSGAEIVEQSAPSLDDIFVARVNRGLQATRSS
ncbi:MAG: ABC transporter ATP-binding protein [Planctomycetaceae bacterium]|nr:ABC transporter ATP-binding protein [Planctomycetaceae bacterium]